MSQAKLSPSHYLQWRYVGKQLILLVTLFLRDMMHMGSLKWTKSITMVKVAFIDAGCLKGKMGIIKWQILC